MSKGNGEKYKRPTSIREDIRPCSSLRKGQSKPRCGMGLVTSSYHNKIFQTRWLINNEYPFRTVLEAGSPNIRVVPASPVLVSVLVEAADSCFRSVSVQGGRSKLAFWPPLTRTWGDPIHGLHPRNPMTSQRPPLQIPSHWN